MSTPPSKQFPENASIDKNYNGDIDNDNDNENNKLSLKEIENEKVSPPSRPRHPILNISSEYKITDDNTNEYPNGYKWKTNYNN